MLFYIILIF